MQNNRTLVFGMLASALRVSLALALLLLDTLWAAGLSDALNSAHHLASSVTIEQISSQALAARLADAYKAAPSIWIDQTLGHAVRSRATKGVVTAAGISVLCVLLVKAPAIATWAAFAYFMVKLPNSGPRKGEQTSNERNDQAILDFLNNTGDLRERLEHRFTNKRFVLDVIGIVDDQLISSFDELEAIFKERGISVTPNAFTEEGVARDIRTLKTALWTELEAIIQTQKKTTPALSPSPAKEVPSKPQPPSDSMDSSPLPTVNAKLFVPGKGRLQVIGLPVRSDLGRTIQRVQLQTPDGKTTLVLDWPFEYSPMTQEEWLSPQAPAHLPSNSAPRTEKKETTIEETEDSFPDEEPVKPVRNEGLIRFYAVDNFHELLEYRITLEEAASLVEIKKHRDKYELEDFEDITSHLIALSVPRKKALAITSLLSTALYKKPENIRKPKSRSRDPQAPKVLATAGILPATVASVPEDEQTLPAEKSAITRDIPTESASPAELEAQVDDANVTARAPGRPPLSRKKREAPVETPAERARLEGDLRSFRERAESFVRGGLTLERIMEKLLIRAFLKPEIHEAYLNGRFAGIEFQKLVTITNGIQDVEESQELASTRRRANNALMAFMGIPDRITWKKMSKVQRAPFVSDFLDPLAQQIDFTLSDLYRFTSDRRRITKKQAETILSALDKLKKQGPAAVNGQSIPTQPSNPVGMIIQPPSTAAFLHRAA